MLAVAFVQQRGVNLLERQLAPLPAGRLVTTTVFGTTTAQGITGAQRNGLRVRVLNPARGTFHSKLTWPGTATGSRPRSARRT